jgi:hypothetical protein
LVRISDQAEEGTVMRPAKAISCILSIVGVCALAPRTPAQTLASRQPIVIAASVVIDGKGHILHDVRIVIEGSKIVAIGPKIEGPVDYDLRGLTVLPGWIDAHVHITWIFGKDGANAGTEGTTQEDAYQAASNAWVTLMAGFTTVQSVGAPNDIPLRDAIAKGILPGPRILTANEPLEGPAWHRLEQIEAYKEDDIKSSGYTVHTLEAAAWSFLTTESYEEAVMGATTPTDKSPQNSRLSPLQEETTLKRAEFHGRGAFLVVGHVVDPRAHGIAPHHPGVAGLQQLTPHSHP